MGSYVTDETSIVPAIGGRLITSATEPSDSDVQTWIDQAEAELEGTLASVGVPTSYSSGTRGYEIIQGWVTEYVAGRVRESHAAAGGDGSNDDGRDQVQRWHDRLMWIRANPEGVGAMLSASGDAPSGSVMPQSHLTDSSLDYETTDAGIAPTFTMGGNNF